VGCISVFKKIVDKIKELELKSFGFPPPPAAKVLFR